MGVDVTAKLAMGIIGSCTVTAFPFVLYRWHCERARIERIGGGIGELGGRLEEVCEDGMSRKREKEMRVRSAMLHDVMVQ